MMEKLLEMLGADSLTTQSDGSMIAHIDGVATPVTGDQLEAVKLAMATGRAIAELVATEMAKDDAARIGRAALLIGEPTTMAALETKLRDAKAAP